MMSSANVLPSAPEYSETPSLYPDLSNGEDFRLKKISDLQKELESEANHYRQVAKKYKRTHTIVHGTAVSFGFISTGLSSATIVTALTGAGLIASPVIAGVAAMTGFSAAGMTLFSRRLQRKITKHEKIYTLALAKRNSVFELVSKALTDKRISDPEFKIILREVESYYELKNEIRSGEAKATNKVNKQTQTPDLEKLRGELRKEVKAEFQKKLNRLTAVSKSDLKD